MRTKSFGTALMKFLCLMTVSMMLVGVFGFLATGIVHADGIVAYVKPSGLSSGSCDSWGNGCNLQYALGLDPLPGEIWVAAGTYYPTTGTDRSISFQLKNGVAVYGGFAGTESLRTERNPKVNTTILSGNIGNQGITSDNSFHVVKGSSTDSSAILDGFTITGGNAFADVSSPWGGGMYNQLGSPTVANLVFSGNTASYGGGMYNLTASPTLTNITFSNNSADRAGGMYNNLNSNPILMNVTFNDNIAFVRGGGMTIAGSSPTLTNVTFSGNIAGYGAGLHNAFGGNPIIKNATFSGNIATTSGGAIFNESSTPTITNSILYDNSGGEISDDHSTPVVTYSIIKGNYPGTGNLNVNPLLGPLLDNGGYTHTMALGVGSPAINAGTNTGCPATDQRGVTRPQGAQCDIGAYEAETNPPDTSIVSYPPNPDTDSTPSFTFSGNDPGGSGIKSFMCQIDSSGYSACASPFTPSVLLLGSHTFYVYAIDYDSNADPSPASYTWTLTTDGPDTTGVFRPTNGALYLKNSNTTGYADVGINYGQGGDYPVVGDWDGDGDTTIGIYRNGSFYLRNSNDIGYADVVFPFGSPGDQPIAGDWNGDGVDTIGVYRSSTFTFYLRNSNTAGTPDAIFQLGIPGDVGIAGDWNGDGIDSTGVFRPSNGVIFLKNTNASGYADIGINYGQGGDKPVTGDWDDDGIDTIGVLRGNTFYLRNSNDIGYADMVFDLGVPGDMPIAGNWDGIP